MGKFNDSLMTEVWPPRGWRLGRDLTYTTKDITADEIKTLKAVGVKIKRAVSGIAMGLISYGKRFAVLSDILGDEDHLGDMDFKVTGTTEGITACQMDIKIKGPTFNI